MADGTPFILSPLAGDTVTNVTLSLSPTPIPSADPSPMFLTSGGTSPSGLRDGQVLTVQDGEFVPDAFAVLGGTLNIEDGRMFDGLEVLNGEINIETGSLGSLGAFAESTVNFNGGRVSLDSFRFELKLPWPRSPVALSTSTTAP